MVESLSDCRAVDLEEVKILRQRVEDCVRREDVNYPQRCREQTIAYMEAFRKYKSQGECRQSVCTVTGGMCQSCFVQVGTRYI